MSEQSKVPFALLTKGIGGPSLGEQYRASNFHKHARPFLSSLAKRLGVKGQVEVVTGMKRESGTVRLNGDRLVVEIAEPEARDGLQLRYYAVDEQSHLQVGTALVEKVNPLRRKEALDDFFWRVRKLMEGDPQQPPIEMDNATRAQLAGAKDGQGDLFI